MSACCSGECSPAKADAGSRFRRALRLALAVNAAMSLVEIVGGLHAGSVFLLVDAVEFAGDAANYGLSLAVLSMGVVGCAHIALSAARSVVRQARGEIAAHGVAAPAGNPCGREA